MRLRRAIPATIATVTGALALVVALAAPAAAHVTVQPGEAPRGAFAKLTFRVPNEHDTASTTAVEVSFPTDHLIAEARTKPVPGWTAKIDRTEAAVTKITWSGGRIAPGEFQEFDVSLRLPGEGDALVFPSVQTYDNGDVVRWIEETPEGGEEPEHPAPVLTLTAGEDGGDGSETTAPDDDDDQDGDEDDDSDVLPVVSLVVALLAVVLSIVALTRRR